MLEFTPHTDQFSSINLRIATTEGPRKANNHDNSWTEDWLSKIYCGHFHFFC